MRLWERSPVLVFPSLLELISQNFNSVSSLASVHMWVEVFIVRNQRFDWLVLVGHYLRDVQRADPVWETSSCSCREEQRIYCLSNFIIFIETISCRVLRHNIRLILSLDQQTKLILECFSKNNYQARSNISNSSKHCFLPL